MLSPDVEEDSDDLLETDDAKGESRLVTKEQCDMCHYRGCSPKQECHNALVITSQNWHGFVTSKLVYYVMYH